MQSLMPAFPSDIEGYSRKRQTNAVPHIRSPPSPQSDVNCESERDPRLWHDFLDIETRSLVLELHHECRFVGCERYDCHLCVASLQRMCASTLFPRSYEEAELQSKCGGDIFIQVADQATGTRVLSDIPDVHLEMSLINGCAYDALADEQGGADTISLAQLEDLMLLVQTKKGNPKPLIAAGTGSTATQDACGKLFFAIKKGLAKLPSAAVQASSEATIRGKKPTFRLLIRAVDSRNQPVNIKPVISNGFLVLTKRAKGDAKVDIPRFEENVRVLEHIGRESARKLGNLKESGMSFPLPDALQSIQTVGQFRELVMLADANQALEDRLKTVLGLKNSWDVVKEHLAKAVQTQLVFRAWFADAASPIGLLFWPEDGKQDAFKPVCLLYRPRGSALVGSAQIDRFRLVHESQKALLRVMMALKAQAEACWWREGHPGWASTGWEALVQIPVLQTLPEAVATVLVQASQLPLHQPARDGVTCEPQNAASKRQADDMFLATQLRSHHQPRKRRGSETPECPIPTEPLPPAGNTLAQASPFLSNQADDCMAAASPAGELFRLRSNSLPAPRNFGEMPGGSAPQLQDRLKKRWSARMPGQLDPPLLHPALPADDQAAAEFEAMSFNAAPAASRAAYRIRTGWLGPESRRQQSPPAAPPPKQLQASAVTANQWPPISQGLPAANNSRPFIGSQQQQHARLAMPGRVPDGALPMQLSGLHQQLAQDMVKLPSHALHDLDLEDSSSTAWPPLKVPDNALLSTFFVSAEEEQPDSEMLPQLSIPEFADRPVPTAFVPPTMDDSETDDEGVMEPPTEELAELSSDAVPYPADFLQLISRLHSQMMTGDRQPRADDIEQLASELGRLQSTRAGGAPLDNVLSSRGDRSGLWAGLSLPSDLLHLDGDLELSALSAFASVEPNGANRA